MSESVKKQVVLDVINKAWDDDNYRAELVASPAAAIKKLTGYELPENAKVVVVDQTDPSVAHINVGPKPDFEDMELSDEQLEAVAGGGEIWLLTLTCVIVGAVSAAVGAAQN